MIRTDSKPNVAETYALRNHGPKAILSDLSVSLVHSAGSLNNFRKCICLILQMIALNQTTSLCVSACMSSTGVN